MKRSRGRLGSVLLTIFMLPLAAIVGLPFYYVVVNTFKRQSQTIHDPLGLPAEWFPDNYIAAFSNPQLGQSFLNSLYVTGVSVAIMLIVGSMAAFGIILRATWFTRIAGVVLVVAFLVPFQSTLIPLYRMFAGLGLIDTLEGLIILASGGAIFSYFLIIGYMRTVPTEVIEAAKIDGAGPFRIYWQIVLPLIRPILITVGVFQVMGVWNDFLTPSVFISSPEKTTIILQVYRAVGQFTTNWPMFMTLSVIVLIPMLVFFIVMQKHIVSGLVSGSVKG